MVFPTFNWRKGQCEYQDHNCHSLHRVKHILLLTDIKDVFPIIGEMTQRLYINAYEIQMYYISTFKSSAYLQQ